MPIRLVFLISLLLCGNVSAQKQIAVTMDDLPALSKYYTGKDGRLYITRQLLGHFATYKIPAVGFVIGGQLKAGGKPDSSQFALLSRWIDAGLELGNHTFAHKDYNNVAFAELKADVMAGEAAVKPFVTQRGRPFRYFRHPYLRKGDTPAKKDSLEAFLKRHGYREAPVTIDNYDWQFSQAYDHARLLGDTALVAQIGQRYVAYMLDFVAYYEAQSQALFGRLIPQVLLTHANAINADYFGQLAQRIVERGYTFTTLEAALTDKAYQSPDRYVGRGGISWLHRWALTQGKKGAFFTGEPEVPADVVELANREL